MEYKWLNKKNNKKLIIFFNGWGMDENVVKHLEPGDYDVIMFYDYNSLGCDISLDNYSEKFLVAWSMGVMVATLFDIEYKTKTAINGTLKPIDDNFGIPVRVYDLTLNHLNPVKFMKNMYDNVDDIPTISRDFENQKSELAVLKTYKADESFKYDRVIISDSDKIIPTKNQVKFWKKEPNIQGAHCIFPYFSNWGELL